MAREGEGHDLSEEVRRTVVEAMKSGEPFSIRVRALVGADVLWVALTAEVERSGGRARKIFGVLQDVTGVVLREQQLLPEVRVASFQDLFQSLRWPR